MIHQAEMFEEKGSGFPLLMIAGGGVKAHGGSFLFAFL
jgi:hypothetical protein